MVFLLTAYFENIMSIEVNSLSSNLILHTTLYRNQQGCCNKLIAQVWYGLIPIAAAVEILFAATITALSSVLYPCSAKPFAFAVKWLNSSAFSFVWSMVDFIMNPAATVLVADEKSARLIKKNGNFWVYPPGSVI